MEILYTKVKYETHKLKYIIENDKYCFLRGRNSMNNKVYLGSWHTKNHSIVVIIDNNEIKYDYSIYKQLNVCGTIRTFIEKYENITNISDVEFFTKYKYILNFLSDINNN